MAKGSNDTDQRNQLKSLGWRHEEVFRHGSII